jgi:nickel-dependent lactate racemase
MGKTESGLKENMIHRKKSADYLSQDEVVQTLHVGLKSQYANQRVLVLIPDHTRTLPLSFLFRTVIDVLHDARQLDFMIALGTHPALSEAQINRLLGINAQERGTRYASHRILNHAWSDPNALQSIGTISQDEVKEIAGAQWHPSLGGDVPVQINKTIFDYDHLVVLGPTFPHEVVGFSGGAKYLFPGISGPEMINATHWLGALSGVVGTIGIKDTPVRAMIHAAAHKLSVPLTLVALVVDHQELAGIFIGDHLEAWRAAADLSAQRHIQWVYQPYQRVLSCPALMYDELWTAAKAMYKLEPAIAPGGELIIYAPHLDAVSRVHGKYIYEAGYHILPYFLQNWQRYQHIPLGVLAHLTHLKGSGVMENGQEKLDIKVTLASQIPPEDCERLSLGYLDPSSIDIQEWQNQEGEGILHVPDAGEILYRLKPATSSTAE